MKKIISITLLIVSLSFGFVTAQDSTLQQSASQPDTTIRNIEFFRSIDDYANAAVHESDSLEKYMYLSLFVLALFGCGAFWIASRLKSKEYEKIINLMNSKLGILKLQSESYGYILNTMSFPCCLVNSDGKISWCNSAFYKLYGNNIKEFDIFVGASSELNKDSVLNAKSSESYYVKVKDLYGKVIGFKRTIVPLPNTANGSTNYAVTENYEIN